MCYNTRFGRAAHNIDQDVSMEQYAHHIAGLTTPTQEAPTKKNSLDRLLKGPEAEIWSRSNASEWGRILPNGVGKSRPESKSIAGTGTTFFINKSQVPKVRKVTYTNWVCNIRPQKTETHRVQMNARGDRLVSPYNVSSPPGSMPNKKLHINSTISDTHLGTCYPGIIISNFYLGTDMTYHQYMQLHP